MKYANKESLATYNGQPLLNEAGMEAVSALLDAHIGYDDAKMLGLAEIRALENQIEGLKSRKQELVDIKDRQSDEQSRARRSHEHSLKQATQPEARDNNSVYAAVLRAATSNPNRSLWHPESLAATDEIGRSFVEFDEALRSYNSSQPAMVIETERSGWRNVFVSRTKPLSKGLHPTTIQVREPHADKRIERGALELPVREGATSVFQINPRTFGREHYLDDYTREPSEYSTIQDGFKLLLPDGGPSGIGVVGNYDAQDGIAELVGDFDWVRQSKVTIAVGNLSVARAITELQTSFAEHAHYPEKQQLLFEQLSYRALGKSLALQQPT